MIISYTTCKDYEAFLCVPKGVTWRLEVNVKSFDEAAMDDEESYTDYCVNLVTSDGMDQTVLVSEDYQYSDEYMAKDDNTLARLSSREADVLRYRFGMVDGDYHTLEEIGEKCGLTRERIRQIEFKALRKLRMPSNAEQLLDFCG